jgi:hypothetical protein
MTEETFDEIEVLNVLIVSMEESGNGKAILLLQPIDIGDICIISNADDEAELRMGGKLISLTL